MDAPKIAPQRKTCETVVGGSGTARGWAANEFTERGVDTLVLEHCSNVGHGENYVTEHKPSWDMDYPDTVAARTSKSIICGNQCRVRSTPITNVSSSKTTSSRTPSTTRSHFCGCGAIWVGGSGVLMHRTHGRNYRLCPRELEKKYSNAPQALPSVDTSHQMNRTNACKGQAEPACPLDYAVPLTETRFLGVVALQAGTPTR